jgi:uracil-DNA glycosylase
MRIQPQTRHGGRDAPRTPPRSGAVGTSALEFLPPRISLKSLREASAGCRGCALYQHATQTVFGEGKASAHVVIVGEQPGNDEDREGHPFVGPAGRVLDRALQAAGIERTDTYVTNVVKHFKWEPRGKRRLHKKPSAREIGACLPWLQKELELIQPTVLVCLGATAAQAILGKNFRVTHDRGKAFATAFAQKTIATIHPSSILRQRTDDDRHREMDRFVADLQVAASLLNGRGPV